MCTSATLSLSLYFATIHTVSKQKNELGDADITVISSKTKGYSGSDMDGLCREAALGPIREIPPSEIQNIALDSVRGSNV